MKNVLFSAALALATGFIATSASADILGQGPSLLGSGFTVDTRIGLGTLQAGAFDGGMGEMTHTIDATSVADFTAGFSSCGICPNPNGGGTQELSVTGVLGGNVNMNSLGKVAGSSAANPTVLQVQHALAGEYSLGITPGFTPAPVVPSE